MVNPALVAAAREMPPQRVLVTGGSGFVGSHLARALAAGGHDVTACGRNPYRVPFAADGPRFVRCPLTDRNRTMELCREKDLVYHAGACCAPWGNRQQFRSINVDGTQNVVDGCREHNVERLVHVSSTAIQFDFHDARGVAESAPLAAPFACHYAWSKAEAEAIVWNAVQSGLNAVIIRARAVFGPGDNSLLPRLLEAADRGRLRQLGADDTQLDLTFIDNLVLALIRAGDYGRLGGVYTITNGEPVRLWPFVKEVLHKTGRSQELRGVSKSVAVSIAGLAEHWHRIRGADGEPPLTRYAAGLLSTTKTYDISAARRELGFEPIVSLSDGTQQTVAALTKRDEAPAKVPVRVQVFTTGYTVAATRLVEENAPASTQSRFHALFAVVDHPVHGLSLFDTGYAPRFFDVTQRWPYSIYRRVTPVVTHERLAAVEVLRANGIDPGDVRRIILSHFHADHVCGLSDFPHADVIASRRCWHAVRRRTGLSALRRAFLPDLIPDQIEDRLFLLDQFHDPGFGPFDRTHDLFADGSVRVVDLSGHAVGQIGALIQTGPDDRALLAADAVWTSRSFRENLRPTWPVRVLADSIRETTATQHRLHELHRRIPGIEIIPTHCPEVAARYGFDACVDEIVRTGAVKAREAATCAS